MVYQQKSIGTTSQRAVLIMKHFMLLITVIYSTEILQLLILSLKAQSQF